MIKFICLPFQTLIALKRQKFAMCQNEVRKEWRDALYCKCDVTLSTIVARFECAIQKLWLLSSKYCYGKAGRVLLTVRMRMHDFCKCAYYIKRMLYKMHVYAYDELHSPMVRKTKKINPDRIITKKQKLPWLKDFYSN